ncbi:MAG: selenide, water dikinase SelD [Chitinispirillaceae bacterium]|nr:selenide, water dikinase SelD [Chitinispirillaceae bacterium]
MPFDLLTTVEYGGCSAKLSPAQLAEVLKDLPEIRHERLLVDISTHDDAGVWKLTDDIALIQTTDFFPPVCSDPYEFGQIAAANALSDVYAMGGTPINALNIVMFPQSRIPLEVLREILRGGMDKVAESGAVIVGGHTIDDFPPKYGLAVTGTAHPSHITTNAAARPGEDLILTKAIGTGAIVAGHRIGETKPAAYRAAIESMKQLNKSGATVMNHYNVCSATDITGFSLLGHAMKMADASNVTIEIDAAAVPLLDDAYRLVELGCIPGASFRNQAFVGDQCTFSDSVDYNLKMLLFDPQTSGGLLFSVAHEKARDALAELRDSGHSCASIIGRVVSRADKALIVNQA